MGSTESTPKTIDFVEEAISSNAVVLFSKTYCLYSKKAKKAFAAARATGAKVYELDQMGAQGSAIQRYF